MATTEELERRMRAFAEQKCSELGGVSVSEEECWPAVVEHGVITSLAPALSLVLLGLGLLRGQWAVAQWPEAGFVVYQVPVLLLLVPIEWPYEESPEIVGSQAAGLGL